MLRVVSITGKAIWYIESHLSDGLSLESVAAAAGVSPFHLSRVFPLTTRHSPAAYIRARRLTEAAKRLAGGAPDILTVALEAGYGSHEAFTRAFRQHFGITPEQLRAQAEVSNLPLQEPLPMNPTTAAAFQSPRLVSGPEMLIFGLSERYACQTNAGIPAQWSRFVPHIGAIPNQAGQIVYGVCSNADEAGSYDYICGVEVSEVPAYPAEFTAIRLHARTYCVIEHKGHISTIAATWKAIWEHGAPPGYQADDAPSFERYDERFDARTGLGGLEIWIPIRPF